MKLETWKFIKKNWRYITGILLTLIVIPVIIDWFIIGNKIPSNISNENWVSFLGSYVGGISGGVFSIIGVFITIQYFRDKDDEEKKAKNQLMIEQIKKEYQIKYYFEFIEILADFDREFDSYIRKLCLGWFSFLDKVCNNDYNIGEVYDMYEKSNLFFDYRTVREELRKKISKIKRFYYDKIELFKNIETYDNFEKSINEFIEFMIKIEVSEKFISKGALEHKEYLINEVKKLDGAKIIKIENFIDVTKSFMNTRYMANVNLIDEIKARINKID